MEKRYTRCISGTRLYLGLGYDPDAELPAAPASLPGASAPPPRGRGSATGLQKHVGSTTMAPKRHMKERYVKEFPSDPGLSGKPARIPRKSVVGGGPVVRNCRQNVDLGWARSH
jgi:hypothetical protein